MKQLCTWCWKPVGLIRDGVRPAPHKCPHGEWCVGGNPSLIYSDIKEPVCKLCIADIKTALSAERIG